jgi:DNA repair photolyase
MTRIYETKAKTILIRSNLPDTDYVVNPYLGCEFGCHYCYASFMGRHVGEPIEEWGNYVYVKTNAVELFRKHLSCMRNKKASILLSSVTDPYQGVEAKYKLTRGILEALVEIDYQGIISILTKSSMVRRDIELFKKLKNIEVGLTVTSAEDKLCRFMEARSSKASVRLKVLKELNDIGITTYAFIGPLMPYCYMDLKKLDELFKKIAKTGTKEIYVEHLNLKPYILKRLAPLLEERHKYIQNIYKDKKSIGKIIDMLVKKYGLKLRLDATLEH